MLIALNSRNEHVLAFEERKSERRSYFCPACKGKTCLKQGEIKLPHFAHLHSEKCQVFSEGETKEHLSGKRMLYNWFVQQGIPCQLEAYIPSLKQRPDLVAWLSSDQPCAIEFQCSPLSIQRLEERTRGYHSAGYSVYWILGNHFYPKKKLTTSQRAFFTYSQELGFQLYYLDTFKKELVCLVQIQEEEPSKKLKYQSVYFSLLKNKHSITQLRNTLSTLKNNKGLPGNQPEAQQLQFCHFHLNQSRFYGVTEIVKFQHYLYEQRQSIVTIPIEVYFPFYKNSGIKTHSYYWRYLIIEWISTKELGETFLESAYKMYVVKLINEKKIELYRLPQLSTTRLVSTFLAYLSTLKEFGLIEKVGNQQWILLNKPYFYKNENEKMTAFKQYSRRK